MDKESFGAALAEHRKQQGMTQRQLAEKLHLTDKAVSKWERGLSYPDVTILEPLADALSISVEALLRCEGPVPVGKDETMQEEQKKQQEPIQNLVELSSENLKRERKRSRKCDVYRYAWEDLYGADCSLADHLNDGVQLDASLWCWDNTYYLTSENTVRFYTYMPNLDHFDENGNYIRTLWVLTSLRKDEVQDWQYIDCDCDGELELIVHTRWPEAPYALYDTPAVGQVTKFLTEAEYQKIVGQ